MEISSSSHTNCLTRNSRSFQGLPRNPVMFNDLIGTAGKYAGEYLGLPEQKLLSACTTFLVQPALDLKYAEEDKKADIAVKSASKAIAGGITGVGIRSWINSYLNKHAGMAYGMSIRKSRLNDFLFPSNAVKLAGLNPQYAHHRLKMYISMLSNFTAIGIMALYTNSKIDFPLTGDIQDFFNGMTKENKTWYHSLRDVAADRFERITRFIKNKLKIIDITRIKSKLIYRVLTEKLPDRSRYPKKADNAGTGRKIS